MRSDNGGEYLMKEFIRYLKSKGIRHELTVPYSPQQNGVAERMMNRTLMVARWCLCQSPWQVLGLSCGLCSLPKKPYPHVCFTRKQDTMHLLKGWSGRKTDPSHLKVFGCVAYTHVPDSQRQKLDSKAVKLRFVGYSIQSKGRLIDERQRCTHVEMLCLPNKILRKPLYFLS